MNAFSGYFVPSGCPDNPDAADELLAKITKKELEVHPVYFDEVMQKLKWVREGGRLSEFVHRSDLEFAAELEELPELAQRYREGLFQASLRPALKTLSPKELETQLSRMFSDCLGTPVSVILSEITTKFDAGSLLEEICQLNMSLSLSKSQSDLNESDPLSF